MLRLVDHSTRDVLGSSIYWDSIRNWRQSNWFWDIMAFNNVYYIDPVGPYLWDLEFRSPAIDFRRYVGGQGSPSSKTVQDILGTAPSTNDLPPRLAKLKTLDSILYFLKREFQGQQELQKGSKTEHETGHTNLVGTVETGCIPADVAGGPESKFLTKFAVEYPGGPVTFYGPLSEWYFRRPSRIAAHWLQAIKDDLNNATGAVSGLLNWEVKDFDIHYVGSEPCGVAYTVIQKTWGGQTDGISEFLGWKEIRIGYGMMWGYTPTTYQPSPYLYRYYSPNLRKRVRCIRHYLRNAGDPIVWNTEESFGPDPLTWGTSDVWEEPYLWTWACSSSPQLGWENYSGLSGLRGQTRVDTGPTSFLAFRRASLKHSSDFLPMGFLAQGNAIDTQFRDLDANLVESLTEVADLFQLISSPLDVLDQCITLAYRTKSPTLVGKPITDGKWLKTLLDMLSDATLYYSFMAAPTGKLAAEMAAKAKRLSRGFDELYGPHTMNGKAVYVIGDEIPELRDCIVVGRSKVRYMIPPSIALAAILPLERLHLLPDLATYWETMRLAFAVDWFFNIKAKLRVIDHTVKSHGLVVDGVVNSVSVYKPIEPVNFVARDGAAYKYYYRYLLQEPQVFTPTVLNVLAGYGIPNWQVFGSLVYKLAS